jgi:hypothetical protein
MTETGQGVIPNQVLNLLQDLSISESQYKDRSVSMSWEYFKTPNFLDTLDQFSIISYIVEVTLLTIRLRD